MHNAGIVHLQLRPELAFGPLLSHGDTHTRVILPRRQMASGTAQLSVRLFRKDAEGREPAPA